VIYFDSLRNPNLLIDKYIEYNFTNQLKLAKGKQISYEDQNPPQFGLDRFYTTIPDKNLGSLIKSSIEEKDYDSTYLQKSRSKICVMIFKSGNNIKRIIYNKGNLPSDLDSLHECLYNYFEKKNLSTEKPFHTDSLVFEFQKYMFKRLPPPPPPLKILHFTPPVIKPD